MELNYVIDKSTIAEILSYPLLIEHLRKSFSKSSSFEIPERPHYALVVEEEGLQEEERSSSGAGTLLLMPAWCQAPQSAYIGVKIVSVFPGNGSRGLPAVAGSYFLSSSETGRPLAVMDGSELTLWRTACASALAADILARKDSQVMVMVGSGALAPHLIKAHLCVRPTLKKIVIWNRTYSNACKLAKTLRTTECLSGKEIDACFDLETAVRDGDSVSCATLSNEPLVLGSWLAPGTHLDLVGSFTPSMRECDDEAVKLARVFVDTETAVKESGDLQQPISRNVISETHVVGTLADLTQAKVAGRHTAEEITLFKSVGTALEDLATAQLVYEALK